VKKGKDNDKEKEVKKKEHRKDEKRTKRAKWDGTSLGSRCHLITLIQTKATF